MKLSRLIILALVVAMSAACEEKTLVIPSDGVEDEEPVEVEDDEHHHRPDDDDGHGPDPDAQVQEVGFLTGSWRVARMEDDAPVAYFDLFDYVSEEEGDGTFVMGLVPVEMFDGARGDVIEARWQNETMLVEWNPTSQQEERYVIESTEVLDENLLHGEFRARQAPFGFAVTIERIEPAQE